VREEARVWSNYSIPWVWNSAGLYIYINKNLKLELLLNFDIVVCRYIRTQLSSNGCTRIIKNYYTSLRV
jgi:hypothetical protein